MHHKWASTGKLNTDYITNKGYWAELTKQPSYVHRVITVISYLKVIPIHDMAYRGSR
jgi:hypothetical protein